MYCRDCGKELPEKSAFCAFCGMSQATSPQSVNARQEAIETATPISRRDNRTKRKGTAAVIAGVFVVLTVATCLFTGIFAPVLELDVGDDYAFGGYDWIVLDVQDNKALLLTKDIVDLRPYNVAAEEVNWETCSLRSWLNGEFMTALLWRRKNKLLCRNSNWIIALRVLSAQTQSRTMTVFG